MLELTKHGIARLFERVQNKAQNKNKEKAEQFLTKVLERGFAVANDAQQMLVVYANNLYIFKKNLNQLLFITVKTCEQQKFDSYTRGKKRSMSIKKNFALCA